MGFSVRGPCAFGGFGDQRRPRAIRRPRGAAPASAGPGPRPMKTIAETSLRGLAPVLIVGAVKTIVTIAVLSEKITEVGDSVTKLNVKLGALATKFDQLEVETAVGAKFDALDTKVGKLDAKVGKLEPKVDVKFEVLGSMEAKLDAKFDKLESKLDAKFSKLETRMDANFNMLTTRLDTLVAQGVLPRRK